MARGAAHRAGQGNTWHQQEASLLQTALPVLRASFRRRDSLLKRSVLDVLQASMEGQLASPHARLVRTDRHPAEMVALGLASAQLDILDQTVQARLVTA